MRLSSTVSTCKLLGNDRFVVNAVGIGSFPLAVGTVRNSAQDFLQAVAEVGTSGPLSHGVVAAESGISRSWLGTGIRGKTSCGGGGPRCPPVRDAQLLVGPARGGIDVRGPSPPSPSDPPRCDRPSRQISELSPNSPDRALRFTAIRASERFRGRVALPALSGPLPRSAITHASARNARHDAPRGPIRPRLQSTKRPASASRRALKQLHGVCLGRSAPLIGWNPPSK